MDERRCRERTDQRLLAAGERRAGDAEWASAWANYKPDAFSPDPVGDCAELAEALIIALRRHMQMIEVVPKRERRRTHPEHVVGPPEWWETEFNRRATAQCGYRKQHVRMALGITSENRPTDFAAMQELLRKYLRDQEQAGESLWLTLFSERIEDGETLWEGRLHKVWSGPPRTVDTDRDASHWWDGFQPLYFLQSEAEYVALELHCEPFEVIEWMLLDEPLQPTWLKVEADVPVFDEVEGTTPMVDEAFFTIHVGSPMVTPSDAAKAYADARREFFGDDGDKRAPRLWPIRVRAFMTEREAEHGSKEWEASFREFNDRYTDSPYKTMRTFRNAFYGRTNKGGKP